LVRQVSEDFFAYAGFTREWSARLKLVVDELFMNSIRYGSVKNESKIYLKFTLNDNEVSFTIEDEGRGEKKVSAEDLQAVVLKNSAELEDITKTSGRGLALISTLWTDGLIITQGAHGGLAVTFKKTVTDQLPPVPPMLNITPVESADLKSDKTVSPVSDAGPREIIALDGEIDSSNIDAKIKPVNDKLAELPEKGILILDCTNLTYFNSTFIGHLAEWHNKLQQKSGQLVLKNTNKEVREVLDLVGLSRVIYLET